MISDTIKKAAGWLLVLGLISAVSADIPFKSIVLPAVPSAAELAAAEELKLHLEPVAGCKAVISKENAKFAVPAVYLGNTQFSQKSNSRCQISGRDAWRIKRVGRDLVITGTPAVGTLYGVYEFLEKYCGILWLDQYYTHFPVKGTVRIPSKLDVSGKPAFAYRGIFTTFNEGPGRVRFLIRNRENLFFEDRQAQKELARWGFAPVFGSPGCQDTLWQYVKQWPEKGMEACYSLNSSGQRVRAVGYTGPGQVCYTNLKTRQQFIAQLKNFIAADRKKAGKEYPKLYCIIQNDVDERCECPGCLAAEKKYGAYAGVLLEFVNAVAQEIQKSYPDVLIQTDAYMNTELPPVRGIRAAENVRVRFTPFSWKKNRYDSMRPLNMPGNRQADDCQKWSRIARIHIWDYWVLFGSTAGNNAGVIPILAMVENHRLYKKCGSEYVFSECEYPDRSSFHPLRVWLGYQIKLDPDQPPEALVEKFFKGYYGKAASPMHKLYSLILARQAEAPRLDAADADARTYLDTDFFIAAEKLLAAAEKLAAGNQEILEHISNERVPLDIARLRRIGETKGLPGTEIVKKRLRQNWRKSIRRWYFGEREKRNIKVMDEFFASVSRMTQGAQYPLPPEIRSAQVFDITHADFKTASTASYGTCIVADPQAVGGKAMMISQTKRNIDPQKFHGKNAASFRFGVYSSMAKKHLKEVGLAKWKFPKDEKYHLYKIGTVDLDPSCMVWAADWLIQHRLDNLFVHGADNRYTIYISLKLQGPAYVKGSQKVNAVFCDRIIAVPVKP